jgi:uncharacterized protein (TIGR02001 family)
MQGNLTAVICAAGVIWSSLAAWAKAAEETPAAPAGGSFTSNVGLYSNYVFRGMSYTDGRPAVQGGFDYTNGGWYVGTYATNVNRNALPDLKQTDNPAANSRISMEWDVYGGYNFTPSEGWTVSAGLYNFAYPGASNISTLEANIGVTWKFLQLRYNHALSDYFSIPGSKGTRYLEANLNFPLAGGWSISGHIGRQTVKGLQNYPIAFGGPLPSSLADYTDYKLGLTKDIGNGVVLGLAATDTNGDAAYYTSASGTRMGKRQVIASVSRSF